MELGAFSVSLAVKDFEASRRFYEKLGSHVFMGDAAQSWLIMENGYCTIGPVSRHVREKHPYTFNPGWDSNARKPTSFADIRELQRQAS